MWQAIRCFFKRFLPPPVRSFNREIERVLKAEENTKSELSGQILLLSSALKEQQEFVAHRLAGLEAVSMEQQELAAHRFAGLEAALDEQQTFIAHRLAGLEAVSAEQQIFNAELTAEIRKILQMGEQYFKDLRGMLDTGNIQMEDFTQLLKERTGQLQQGLQHVEQIVPNHPVYWSSEFERKIVRENWGDVTEQPDFAEKFIRLTAGLDAASVEIIIRILMRQKQYLHSDEKTLNLFTRAEQEELRLLRENFDSEIMKLSDNLYAYRNYLLPVKLFEPSVFYYKHGIGQLKTLDRVKGRTIIDVGGFIGDSVLILSELNPDIICTFEAVPENFALLKRTVELNHIEHVVAENVALGSEAGSFTIHVNGSVSTSIERPGINFKEDIQVPVITLDEYVQKNHLDVSMIKVDIEGGEPAFLQGAKRTICEQKPILLLSIYHNAHDFFELKPLIESWNLGYSFQIHKPTYGNATSETLLVAEIVSPELQ